MSTIKTNNIQNAGSATTNVALDTNGNATVGGTLAMGSSFLRNRLINGSMAVDQRNAGAAQTITAAAALAYTVDRWYAYCTGANVTGQRVTGAVANTYRYQFTGAASVTAIGFAQRIEALNSADLAGKTATLSVDLANSLLTTVTWTAYYANTTDTFGTLASPTRTQIATGTFTVNSTVTRYSTNISIPAAATTGIEIVLTVGAQTSGTWTIGNAQLEEGTVATPFERRSYGQELALAQRYYYQRSSTGVNDIIGIVAAYAANGVWGKYFDFPVEGRNNSPTVTTSATSTIGVSPVGGGVAYAVSSIGTSVGSSRSASNTGGITITSSPFAAGQATFLIFATSSGWIAASWEL